MFKKQWAVHLRAPVDKNLNIRETSSDDVSAGIEIIKNISFHVVLDEKIDGFFRIIPKRNSFHFALIFHFFKIKIGALRTRHAKGEHPQDQQQF